MENELEKTSKLKVLLESIVKIVANGQHPIMGIGANLYFDYQNAIQYNNVVDFLQKLLEHLEWLNEIVLGKLFVEEPVLKKDLMQAIQLAKDELISEKRDLYASYVTACCHPDNKDWSRKQIYLPSNPQPIGFSGILLAKRQNSFYCTYFLHNRNVADTKSPYPIKRLEVIRWFNQKSMVFNQSLS